MSVDNWTKAPKGAAYKQGGYFYKKVNGQLFHHGGGGSGIWSSCDTPNSMQPVYKRPEYTKQMATDNLCPQLGMVVDVVAVDTYVYVYANVVVTYLGLNLICFMCPDDIESSFVMTGLQFRSPDRRTDEDVLVDAAMDHITEAHHENNAEDIVRCLVKAGYRIPPKTDIVELADMVGSITAEQLIAEGYGKIS